MAGIAAAAGSVVVDDETVAAGGINGPDWTVCRSYPAPECLGSSTNYYFLRTDPFTPRS